MVNLSNNSSKNSEKRNKNFVVETMVSIFGLYQSLFSGRPSTCRFVPSCSSYAIESFEKLGFFKGSFLTFKRICRCHPWGGHGLDPVPGRKRRINVWFIGEFTVLVLWLLAFIWYVDNTFNTVNNGHSYSIDIETDAINDQDSTCSTRAKKDSKQV